MVLTGFRRKCQNKRSFTCDLPLIWSENILSYFDMFCATSVKRFASKYLTSWATSCWIELDYFSCIFSNILYIFLDGVVRYFAWSEFSRNGCICKAWPFRALVHAGKCSPGLAESRMFFVFVFRVAQKCGVGVHIHGIYCNLKCNYAAF